MLIRQRRWNFGIALAAALILLLQSGFDSFAADAGPVQRDIFGNVLCTDSGMESNGSHDSGHLPSCCTLSCTAFAQFPADAANSADDLIPIITAAAATVHPWRDPHPWAGERRPANPRAPPLFA